VAGQDTGESVWEPVISALYESEHDPCSRLNGWIAPRNICEYAGLSCRGSRPLTSRRSAEWRMGLSQVAGNLTVATVPGAPASGTMS
jgi:hypothetical protein